MDERTCECSDPGCPAHYGKSVCHHGATDFLVRCDMDREDGPIAFCDRCAGDALDSGVFTPYNTEYDDEPHNDEEID